MHTRMKRDDTIDDNGDMTMNVTKTYPDGVVYKGGLNKDCKPQGQGKFTYPDGSTYEGEFIDGKDTGKGKVIRFDGSVYEGEFRDGIANGEGKMIRPDGSFREGEFRDGLLHGKGRMVDSKGTVIFEGRFFDGYRVFDIFNEKGNIQNGMISYSNGAEYKGEMTRKGTPEGKGVLKSPNGNVYEGEFRDGIANGEGKMIRPDGSFNEGEFRGGILNGKGKMTKSEGFVYEGEFRDGELFGNCKITDPRGFVFEGGCKNFKPSGKCKMTTTDGNVYEGKFRDGKLFGNCKITYTRGFVYEGGCQKLKPSGKGKMTKSNGNVYEGEFLNGMLNGKGKHTNSNGATVFEGEFCNDMPVLDVVSQPKKTRRGHRGGKKKTTKDLLRSVPESCTEDWDDSDRADLDADVSHLCDLNDVRLTTEPSSHINEEETESSMGGQNSCIICFSDEKTHMAAPCGHICVCGSCAAKLLECQYCRSQTSMWIRARLV